MRSTIWSELHQAKTFVPSAIARAIRAPLRPPSSQPIARNRAVMAASNRPVRAMFMRSPPPVKLSVLRWWCCPARPRCRLTVGRLRHLAHGRTRWPTRDEEGSMNGQELRGVEQVAPSNHVTAEEALELHARGRPGKIEITATKPL